MKNSDELDLKAGTQELREAYMNACREFVKKWKARWEKEGFVFTDETMLWAFRRVVKELGEGKLNIEEFVQPKNSAWVKAKDTQ